MVCLEDADRPRDAVERLSQMLGGDEIQIVSRGVVLGKFTVLTPLEQADRQIESRRTILALVVTVRPEILGISATHV